MSISYGIYVGPYARCAVGTKEAQRLHITCPNAGCANHGKDVRSEFCGRCGARVESLPQAYTDDMVDQWDIRERIDDRLRSPGGDGYMRWVDEHRAHLWIPNVGMPGRDMHLEAHEDFALYDFTPGLVQVETAQFGIFFGPELAILHGAYGASAVSLHWGVIQDYS